MPTIKPQEGIKKEGQGHNKTPLSYIGEPMPFPSFTPEGFKLDLDALKLVEPSSYDSTKDLSFTPPDYIVNLRFERMNLSGKNWNDENFQAELKTFLEPGLAFSAPFKLLTPDTVGKLRQIVIHHSANPNIIHKKTDRQSWSLRGLGYASHFIRDLNECPQVRDICSKLAGEPLGHHSFVTNYSHVNIGVSGTGRPVDKWHNDSVDYVLVLLLTDAEGFKGGELQVVNKTGEEAKTILKKDKPDPSEVMTVQFPAPGYGILMQGSAIYHQVAPVLSSSVGPRISIVNSFMPLNVFGRDQTKYATFRDGDPETIASVEYARHRARRVRGMMDYIMGEIDFAYGKSPEEEATMGKERALHVMDQAIYELQETRDLLLGLKDDTIGYFDSMNKSFRGYNNKELES